MMFSRSCEYGLQAALYIAVERNANRNSVVLPEIATSQGIPLPYLSKILQILVHKGVLVSKRGADGGFSLSKPADKITLLEVVGAIDGLEMFDRCGIGLRACSDENPCPVHHEYKVIKNKVRQVLSQKTLAELSRDVERGTAIIAFKRRKSNAEAAA